VLRPGCEDRGGGVRSRVLRMTMLTALAVDGASVSRLTATVRRLASDEFAGRRVGTPGGRAAGRWLAAQLRALGATVTAENFAVTGLGELYATPVLAWTDAAGTVHHLAHRRDFAEHLTSADLPDLGGGPLVTVGAGDWSGRWVLAPAVTSELATRAADTGAVGLLVPRGVDSEGWMPKLLAGPPAGPLPVLALRTDLHNAMTREGGEVSAAVPLRTVAVTGTNVHGVFSAPSPGRASVLLTAHYDGVGDDPDQRLPGAADNASGCAVVLEAARQLASALPPGTGLAVAFLDAEEAGALGSAHHAPQVPAGTCVINVDGAGRLDEAAAVEAGGPAHALLAALDQAGRHTGIPLRGAPMASDNRRYAAAGLPAIGIGMGIPGYQTPAETPDRVEPATLRAATQLVVAAVHHLTTTEEQPMNNEHLPVAVIGAGPVGLAAAAHLAERGIDFVVLEAGGTVATSIAQWGHVQLFSPWRYNLDAAARRLLHTTGWAEPELDQLPTGGELIAGYLTPLAAHPAIAPALRYGAQVEAITRAGYDRVRSAGREQAPFLLRLANGEELAARAVIDASGTWTNPNVLGASGLPAYGETGIADQALPDVLGADRHRYAGKHTLVVGAGHSAANTLLALAELAKGEPGTEITWALRGTAADRTYGGGDADALPARGALGSRLRTLVGSGGVTLLTGFRTHRLISDGDRVTVVSRDPSGAEQKVTVDRIVAATGYRPDHSVTAELRLDLDPILGSTRALAPLIDPNEHSCGTVPPHGVDELTHPEPGYYAIGVKSYGRAPTFLLATGYEQARSVVAAIAGDWDAARDVRLDLPETGVCSSNLVLEPANSCCG